MNINPKTRRLVICALFSAIILALGLPGSPLNVIGYIRLQPFSATTVHLPVIIGAILEGPVVGLILGTVFGLTSLISAITMPGDVTAPAFMNPLVSVLPRMLVGLAAALIFRALARRLNGHWAVGLAAAGASLVNTGAVFAMIYLIARFVPAIATVAASFTPILLVVLGTNAVPEALVAAAVSIPIIRAMQPLYRGRARQQPNANFDTQGKGDSA